MTVARYDGHAAWCDNWRTPHVPATVREVTSLLGPLNAFIRTGLAIGHVAQSGDRAVPRTLAIRARKTPAP